MEYILTLNLGSSSLKFSLFNYELDLVSTGVYERIGVDGKLKYEHDEEKVKKEIELDNHKSALDNLIELLNELNISRDHVRLICHRVVHGGEKYSEPTVLDEDILEDLKNYSYLAPLHNPNNIKGIEIALEKFDAKNIAVFDTSFHSSISKTNYMYSLPKKLYKEYSIRKYGFHGTSHQFIAEKLKEMDVKGNKHIVCHLGNGSSITALKDFKSFNNSMGLTPLDGVVMGTRVGSIDPGVILFLLDNGFSKEEVDKILNKKSGLLGLSGKNSVKDLYESAKEIEDVKNIYSVDSDSDELFTLKYLVNSISSIIGSYVSQLSGVDAIAFTGGIGENAYYIRELVMKQLSYLGIKIDSEANKNNSTKITKKESDVDCYVIETNEELMMAKIGKTMD
ncbi:MAG: acetate/propionate family kinase [Candidatus Woesearchaeota archaeon]